MNKKDLFQKISPKLTENAPLALEMIRTALGGRPTLNTLQTFVLIAEYGSGDARVMERLLNVTTGTMSRALAFWTDKELIDREHVLRNLRIRRFRVTYEGRAFYRRLKVALDSGTIPPPDPEVVETEGEPEIGDPWLKAWLESDEFKEQKRKDEEKRKREDAKHQEWLARREERRRNPKTPIDAYRNWMELCPHPSGSKKRKEWKQANPLVFNSVTYVDHWSPQLSNSGKTTRWHGCLSGSDGSHHEIIDEHINNRRNDPNRNWGLPE
ncbi:DNA-binding MarR family transcriptional regulator [Bradyrhizobium sp. USDA 4341]